MKRRTLFVLAGVMGGAMLLFAATIAGAVWLVVKAVRPAAPREPLSVRLDDDGPFVILATTEAAKSYSAAIKVAKELHPDAEVISFDAGDFASVKKSLDELQPKYALVFIEPDQLDVNFGWRWLDFTTAFDDDPLVDVRTGFITGRDPAAAERFMKRIAAATRGELPPPGKLIDNLGPNTMASEDAFYLSRGCFMAPVFDERYSLATISHGEAGFTDEQLAKLGDAGLVHLGGHGYPDCIVGGVKAKQVTRLKLAPCVVWSGACYTGVTRRWFDRDAQGANVAEKSVADSDSFCLNLLDNQTLGYLAALHPDHGIPVYQEMEHLAWSGGSLGDAIKHTHDGVILAREKVAAPAPLVSGEPWPKWSNAEVMLHGTAARVLFGDPALVVGEKFTSPPFTIETKSQGESELLATVTMNNDRLMSTFTDTYYADLSADKQLFNDCARFAVDLPADWSAVSDVTVIEAAAGGKKLEYRLVGFAIEDEGAVRRLHVQVDVAAKGYMQSDFRSQKGKLVVKIERRRRP